MSHIDSITMQDRPDLFPIAEHSNVEKRQFREPVVREIPGRGAAESNKRNSLQFPRMKRANA